MARANKTWHFLVRMATVTSSTSFASRPDLSSALVSLEGRDGINWLNGAEPRTLDLEFP
jgi:hypothetical protein